MNYVFTEHPKPHNRDSSLGFAVVMLAIEETIDIDSREDATLT